MPTRSRSSNPYGNRHARPARTLLDSRRKGLAPAMRQLLQQANQLANIEAPVLAALPPELAAQTRCAGFADGTLVLVAASPAWAARLRYQGRLLLRALGPRQAFQGLRRIRVSVARQAPPTPPAPKPRHPDAETQAHLTAFAEQMSPSPLRDALAALAEHTRKP